jgi:hypothetical protein
MLRSKGRVPEIVSEGAQRSLQSGTESWSGTESCAPKRHRLHLTLKFLARWQLPVTLNLLRAD